MKLEVVEVKVNWKDASVEDFLRVHNRYRDLIKEILELNVEIVESKMLIHGDMHQITINENYFIMTSKINKSCSGSHITLKFGDKSFSIFDNSTIVKYGDIERIINSRLEKIIEVIVNGESKINTSVSQEDAQNIIDQIL